MEKETGKKREAVKKIIKSLTPTSASKKKIKEALEVSEEKYKAAFEYTGTGMMILEDDMTITLVNQKIIDMSGYSREEIEGKRKWTELVPEQDREQMMQYHRMRREQPDAVPAEYEFRYRHTSGVFLDALINVSMIPGTKKSLVSMVDITEKKAMQEELIESQRRFKETAELLPSIICEIDRNMQFTYVNKLGLEMFGYSQDELSAGTIVHDIIHAEDRERAMENISLHLAGKPSRPQEYRFVLKDGTVKDFFVTSSRIIKDEEVIGLRSCLVDISDRKRMEHQLRESEERLRSIYAASPIGIAIFNTEGKALDMNHSFKQMFGLPEQVDYSKIEFSLFDDV